MKRLCLVTAVLLILAGCQSKNPEDTPGKSAEPTDTMLQYLMDDS